MGPSAPDKNRRKDRRERRGGSREGLAEVGLGPKDAAAQVGTPPSEDERRHLPGKSFC